MVTCGLVLTGRSCLLQGHLGLRLARNLLPFVTPPPIEPDFTLNISHHPLRGLPRADMHVEEVAAGLRFARPRGILDAAADFRNFEVVLPREQRRPFDGRPWLMLALWGHLAHHEGAFLHGALCLLKGKLVLLLGQQQRGKSTLARLIGRHGGRIVTDEYPFTARGPEGLSVYGSPWPGFAHATAGGPPAVICFLKHGRRNEFAALNTNETIRRLIQTTRFFSWSPRSMPLTMEVLGDLAACAPVYEYAFVPDATAVTALETLL
ncbi:MAG: hypothetical protein ABFE08_20460 [Armatimonadia bacterium]